MTYQQVLMYKRAAEEEQKATNKENKKGKPSDINNKARKPFQVMQDLWDKLVLSSKITSGASKDASKGSSNEIKDASKGLKLGYRKVWLKNKGKVVQ